MPAGAAPECHRLGTGLLKANRPRGRNRRAAIGNPALAHSAGAWLGFKRAIVIAEILGSVVALANPNRIAA